MMSEYEPNAVFDPAIVEAFIDNIQELVDDGVYPELYMQRAHDDVATLSKLIADFVSRGEQLREIPGGSCIPQVYKMFIVGQAMNLEEGIREAVAAALMAGEDHTEVAHQVLEQTIRAVFEFGMHIGRIGYAPSVECRCETEAFRRHKVKRTLRKQSNDITNLN